MQVHVVLRADQGGSISALSDSAVDRSSTWDCARIFARRSRPMLEAKTERTFLDAMLQQHERARQKLRAYVDHVGTRRPIHPEYVAATLDELAGSDTVFTTDTGICCVWGARYLHAAKGRRLLGSFNHGSMANALPQAIGAPDLSRAAGSILNEPWRGLCAQNTRGGIRQGCDGDTKFSLFTCDNLVDRPGHWSAIDKARCRQDGTLSTLSRPPSGSASFRVPARTFKRFEVSRRTHRELRAPAGRARNEREFQGPGPWSRSWPNSPGLGATYFPARQSL